MVHLMLNSESETVANQNQSQELVSRGGIRPNSSHGLQTLRLPRLIWQTTGAEDCFGAVGEAV